MYFSVMEVDRADKPIYAEKMFYLQSSLKDD